ncbi:MAG: zinc ribbon domain-containing protein [Clostridia bacterium]|nr:zinc ribbon domain-containing protein [Clostridia bacterium]
MNKKSVLHLVLKIIGFIGVAVGIAGFIISANGFGDFESNNFMIGSIMGTFGLFVGIACLIFGFAPQIMKAQLNTVQRIQQENKDVLQDIATTQAEITSDAVTTTAAAVKRGLEDQIFCKHCGKQIDADSTFCSSCGGKQ